MLKIAALVAAWGKLGAGLCAFNTCEQHDKQLYKDTVAMVGKNIKSCFQPLNSKVNEINFFSA